MRDLVYGLSGQEIQFFLASAADGKTPLVGKAQLDFAVQQWRAPGAAFAAAAGTISEAGYGWYVYVPTAAEVSSLGEGALHLECAGGDPVDRPVSVVTGTVTLADGAHGGAAATLTLERVMVSSVTPGEPGIRVTGHGAGPGVLAQGGETGPGIRAQGGAVAGEGLHAQAGPGSHGVLAQGGDYGAGLFAEGGQPNGAGMIALAHESGAGILAVGGATSGDGIEAQASAGQPINGPVNLHPDQTGVTVGSVVAIPSTQADVEAGIGARLPPGSTQIAGAGADTTNLDQIAAAVGSLEQSVLLASDADWILDAGVHVAGGYADTQTGNGIYLQISEVAADPGLRVELRFTLPEEAIPRHLVFRGRYQGHPTHRVRPYAWNWAAGAWGRLSATDADDLTHSTTDYLREWPTTSNHVDPGTGEVRIRLDHVPVAGTSPSHGLWIDKINVLAGKLATPLSYEQTVAAAAEAAAPGVAVLTDPSYGLAALRVLLDAIPDTAGIHAEILAALRSDTGSELAGVPPAAPPLADAVQWIYQRLANRETATATAATVANRAGAVIATAPVSDNGTTFVRGGYV